MSQSQVQARSWIRSRSWLPVLLVASLCVGCSSGSSSGGAPTVPGGPGGPGGPGNGGGNGGGNGSGNGGGNGGGDEEFEFLTVYAYQMHSAEDDPLSVRIVGNGDGGVTLRITHDTPHGVSGIVDFETGEIVIDLGSTLVFEETTDTPIYLTEPITVTTTVPWVVPAEGPATAGQLLISIENESNTSVTVNSGIGVNIFHDIGPTGEVDESVNLTWSEFLNLEDGAPFWQVLAEFSYNAKTDFLFNLVAIGLQGMDYIDEDLEDAGSIVLSCDAFSSLGWAVPPPPPVIPDQGLATFTWLDDSADGSAGSGDSFQRNFDYCLEIGGDEQHPVYNNTVALNNLVRQVDDGLLVRLSFDGESSAGRAGGIAFDDFEMIEVYQSNADIPDSVAIAEHMVINGRLQLVLEAP